MAPVPDMNIHAWVDQLGTSTSNTTLVVIGDSDFRSSLYHSVEAPGNLVIGEPYTGSLAQRLDLEGLLTDLVKLKDLHIEDPLVTLIDNGYYRASEAFGLLWEARFTFAEGHQKRARDLGHFLAQWPLGADFEVFEKFELPSELSSIDAHDVLCLWFTLAKYNNLLHRVIIPLENFESEESAGLKSAAERWNSLGCPLGIIFGLNSEEDLRPYPEISKEPTLRQ